MGFNWFYRGSRETTEVPKGFIALFAQHENVHAIKPDKEDPAREAVKEARITIYLA
jgi:hypothetical protein